MGRVVAVVVGANVTVVVAVVVEAVVVGANVTVVVRVVVEAVVVGANVTVVVRVVVEAVVVGANVTVVVAVVVDGAVVGANVAVVVGAVVVASNGGKVVVNTGETTVVMSVSGSDPPTPPYVCACAGCDAPSRSETAGVVVAAFSNSARRRSACVDSRSRCPFMFDPICVVLAVLVTNLVNADPDYSGFTVKQA